MEPLEKELLLRDMQELGYQLVSAEHRNPSLVLAKMLQSKEGRILEGVPVVLSNVLVGRKEFNLAEFEKSLPKPLQKRFRLLAAVTFLYSFWLPAENYLGAQRQLDEYLKVREPSLTDSVKEKLQQDKKLNVGEGVVLDADRLEKTFKNYVVEQFLESHESFSKKLASKRDEAFLGALGELFTDKQRDLLFKMLNGEKLGKTDREYYSRSVKKRLKALVNEDLQSLATRLLEL